MTQQDVALFVVASAVIAIVPGPDILYLVGRGVAQGRRAGVASALGLNVGALVHAALAAFGVSILILKFAPLFYVVKYAGAAYLGYLGLRMILDRSRLSVERPDLPVDLTIALLAGRLGELFARRPSFADRVRWVAGSMLVALGLRVAIADGG